MKETTKYSTIFKKISIFSLLISTLLFFSCKHNLIPENFTAHITGSQTESSLEKPDKPINVKATHGGVNSVILSWNEVKNAAQYKIFAASTPSDEFVQIAETKDSSISIEIKENPGTERYYRIQTVNYQKKVSSLSDYVFGSSLANPIITNIEKIEDGTAVTVNWWMENCSINTYLDSVKYEVICFASDKQTVIQTKTTEKSKTFVTFEGLTPKTLYYYQVNAYTASNQEKKESSDIIDAETARRLIPDPVSNLQIAKGISKDGIEISFTIPHFTDVQINSITYERHPVYFTIMRKLLEESEEEFIPIANYLGTQKAQDESKLIYNFTCAEPHTDNEKIKVYPTINEEAEINETYPDYISLQTVTFIDTTAEQNKQYTYKIQSFVDDTKKTISADFCVVQENGWKIANPSFYATLDLETSTITNEDNSTQEKITQSNVNLFTTFETYNLQNTYSYILTYQYAPFDEENNIITFQDEIFLKNVPSLQDLNPYLINYNFEDTENPVKEGYYKYYLYISPYDSYSDVPTKYFVKNETQGNITITSDPNKFPKINVFTVEDSFKDYFLINFSYNDTNNYSLEYSSYTKEGELISTEKLQIPQDSLVITEDAENGLMAQYKHTASSGDRRKYTITAEAGLQTSVSLKETFETLGTAIVEQTEYNYDSIKIQWNKVQKATNYTINAMYIDNTPITEALAEDIPEGYILNEPTEQNGIFTCVIEKPFGYNKLSYAGKPIKLEVVSSNEKDSSVAKKTVFTIGPSQTNTVIEKTQDKEISVKWNKVPGAKGYIIQRYIYTSPEATTVSSCDTYWYDQETDTITINNEDPGKQRARITSNTEKTTFTLIDKYVEPDTNDGTNAYQVSQSKISWGLPFGYTIIPAKAKEDFTFNERAHTLNLADSKSAITYEDVELPDVKGATFGYGLNLYASKAELSSSQKLEWKKPYNSNTVPTIYRRLSGSNDNYEKVNSNANVNSEEIVLPIEKQERNNAYEYIVKYNNSSFLLKPEASYQTFLDTSLEDRSNYDYTKLNPDGTEKTIETKNKGYLLHTDFTAFYGGTLNTDNTYTKDEYYYSETVSWSPWDYQNRSIGPDSYTISIRNNNLSDKYYPLISFENGKYNQTTTINDTHIIGQDTKIILSPGNAETYKNYDSLITNGYLSVLRDPYHYYMLTLNRESFVSEIGKKDTTDTSDNQGIYTYRQISKAELAKITMLVFSDAFYRSNNGGNFNYEEKKGNGDSNYTGSYSIKHESRASDIYKYNFTEYSTKFNSPGDVNRKDLQVLKITASGIAKRHQTGLGLSVSGSHAKSFDQVNITTNNTSNLPSNLDSYNKIVTFVMSNANENTCDGKITVEDFSITFNNNNRKYWFPMAVLDQDAWYNDSAEYGWWYTESSK